MSPKRLSLTEKVLEKVAASPPRHKSWFDRLDDGYKAELLELRRAWQAGEIKSSAVRLADHISTTMREAGVSTIGMQGVVNWLKTRD